MIIYSLDSFNPYVSQNQLFPQKTPQDTAPTLPMMVPLSQHDTTAEGPAVVGKPVPEENVRAGPHLPKEHVLRAGPNWDKEMGKGITGRMCGRGRDEIRGFPKMVVYQRL